MPRYIKRTESYLIEERLKIVKGLIERGFSSSDIAKIFFNINRSTITRFNKEALKLKKASVK